jgi:hypothetical protein
MRITKRQLRRIIKEEVSRRRLSENVEAAYNKLVAKYDATADMTSMVDATNELANDLTSDQYNQMDGFTQDLDWDEQLEWIKDNRPEWLEDLAAGRPTEEVTELSDEEWGPEDHSALTAALKLDQLLSALASSNDSRWQDVWEQLGKDGTRDLVERALGAVPNADPKQVYRMLRSLARHKFEPQFTSAMIKKYKLDFSYGGRGGFHGATRRGKQEYNAAVAMTGVINDTLGM